VGIEQGLSSWISYARARPVKNAINQMRGRDRREDERPLDYEAKADQESNEQRKDDQ
jgi:hypothetical protein